MFIVKAELERWRVRHTDWLAVHIAAGRRAGQGQSQKPETPTGSCICRARAQVLGQVSVTFSGAVLWSRI